MRIPAIDKGLVWTYINLFIPSSSDRKFSSGRDLNNPSPSVTKTYNHQSIWAASLLLKTTPRAS
jgi:hypothetical protein